VATNSGQFPIISIAIIAGVYGLQAIIFIVKRQWQHIGWMIIYMMAYPIYSFVLPIYSFWNQDNFSWGTTRIVIGEKGDKRIVAVDDEGFDPRSIPLQRWDDYALVNNLPGRRANAGQEKPYRGYTDDTGVEMDDMHSVYSSVKPASTILTGFPTQGPHNNTPYAVPQSPSPYGGSFPGNRNSHMSHFTEQPRNSRHMSLAPSQFQDQRLSTFGAESHLGVPRQSMRASQSRPGSTLLDFRNPPNQGPDEGAITAAIRSCLAEVDLDNVTKKQGM
jgi:chitin synthase